MKIQETLYRAMKDERLHIIASYFSSVAHHGRFVKEVDNLTKGEGGAIEGIMACTFPRQLDEYELSIDEGFDGIEFIMFEEKVSVDVSTFRKYLKMACDTYLQEHPEDRAKIQEYLARPQPPLEDGALPEWKQRRDAGEYSKPISEVENLNR